MLCVVLEKKSKSTAAEEDVISVITEEADITGKEATILISLHMGMTDSNSGIVNKIANQKKVIKAILLDQRQVISGVGNWVADEVLYLECLNDGEEQLPEQWLFHRRWRGGGSKGTNSKDFNGKQSAL
ncbi:hypothetical protein QTG54_014556 [Skeletonema marinoi]|uniref:Formamidopyrimidine-DNA glycosylase H2TH DNA-binding domain-containing protein n=1 Tax=Skeletonema marinoi TaxID=267567 RepID=A0AAD9D6I3_9STRA|nr:hypothetical protein QTG54_014556 [Skeletonema marinoi]